MANMKTGAVAIVAAALIPLGFAMAQHQHAAQEPKGAAPSEVKKAAEPKAAAPKGVQVVEIAVTDDGFVPAEVTVKAGQPVKLRVTRKVDATCARDIVIKTNGVNKPLPLGTPVEVDLTLKKGKVRYACAMDMIAGTITAE